MNVLENGAPILLQFQNWLHVFDCLCVSATKPITHSIRKRFRFGSKSLQGGGGWLPKKGGVAGPTLNPAETTHLFNGAK